MLLSVIVPSYLSHYKGCASYREQKFTRAIDSLLNQTFTDFEIIILADNCDKTRTIYNRLYSDNVKIRFYFETIRGGTWHRVSTLRNLGIQRAAGEYITYLDTDDCVGKNHLRKISQSLSDYDWIWYDDYLMNDKWVPKLITCELKYGKFGTSNITHKQCLPVSWIDGSYKHDFVFLQQLLTFKNYAKVEPGEYFVCHQPGVVDV